MGAGPTHTASSAIFTWTWTHTHRKWGHTHLTADWGPTTTLLLCCPSFRSWSLQQVAATVRISSFICHHHNRRNVSIRKERWREEFFCSRLQPAERPLLRNTSRLHCVSAWIRDCGWNIQECRWCDFLDERTVTYSTGVHIAVDGHRLDAHFTTSFDHLRGRKTSSSFVLEELQWVNRTPDHISVLALPCTRSLLCWRWGSYQRSAEGNRSDLFSSDTTRTLRSTCLSRTRKTPFVFHVPPQHLPHFSLFRLKSHSTVFPLSVHQPPPPPPPRSC